MRQNIGSASGIDLIYILQKKHLDSLISTTISNLPFELKSVPSTSCPGLFVVFFGFLSPHERHSQKWRAGNKVKKKFPEFFAWMMIDENKLHNSCSTGNLELQCIYVIWNSNRVLHLNTLLQGGPCTQSCLQILHWQECHLSSFLRWPSIFIFKMAFFKLIPQS